MARLKRAQLSDADDSLCNARKTLKKFHPFNVAVKLI